MFTSLNKYALDGFSFFFSFLPTRLVISLDGELLMDSFGDGERLRFRFGKGGGLRVCLETFDHNLNSKIDMKTRQGKN